MYDIRLKQIECFLEVAETLNISKTAGKLYISQPLASKWIKSLEEELGCRLFERTKTGLVLTEEGRVLKDKWGHIYNELLRSIEDMHSAGKTAKGVIKIGCIEDFDLGKNVKDIIDGFKKANPEVEIELPVYGPKDLMEQLMKGQVDVAFHTTVDLNENCGVKMMDIAELSSCIAMSKDHRLAKHKKIEIKDLKDEVFYELALRESPRSFVKIRKMCEKAGFEPREIKEFHNISSLGMALRYQGVAVTLRESMASFKSDLKLYDIKDTKYNERLVLIYPKKNYSKLAERFSSFVKEFTA
ncbi:MAG: LysR family transcriptional regulator [Eubacterium sp.]|nr:LysR family transcriptional regulator [Eubacterium sp.]